MHAEERLNSHGTNGNGILKRDAAYRALSDAIIRLELAPLSLIDEAALCARLGLGRTPVREALQRLMHEGLVTVYPRRGAIVTPITALDAEHLSQARLIYEPGIARRAAETGTDAHWDALARLLAQTPAMYRRPDDVVRGTGIDQEFHRGIAEATANPYLIELVDRHLRLRTRLAFLMFQHGIYDPVTEQHYQILDHLRAGRGDDAAALMVQHINVTRERSTRIFA